MGNRKMSDLALADVVTFLAVLRLASLSGAARELGVTTSQVSKAVARLERHLNATLLIRGGRGVAATEAGVRVQPHLEEIVAKVEHLRADEATATPELTLGAPSYLCFTFLPVVASALPQFRLRGLELPAALLRAYAAENFFDVTLTSGPSVRLPPSWEVVHVGDIRRALYGTPALARRLGRAPVAPSKLAKLPFVTPLFYSNGQFVSVDDGCPLAIGERTMGHQAATIALGLELARQTDQLVFGPSMMARAYVDRGELEEIPVEGWGAFDPLFVAFNMDRVLARVKRRVLAAMREALEALQAP